MGNNALMIIAGYLNTGFCAVENCVQPVVVFLNDRFHIFGVLVDASVKVTESGAFPERGVPEKSATCVGAGAGQHVHCSWLPTV